MVNYIVLAPIASSSLSMFLSLLLFHELDTSYPMTNACPWHIALTSTSDKLLPSSFIPIIWAPSIDPLNFACTAPFLDTLPLASDDSLLNLLVPRFDTADED